MFAYHAALIASGSTPCGVLQRPWFAACRTRSIASSALSAWTFKMYVPSRHGYSIANVLLMSILRCAARALSYPKPRPIQYVVASAREIESAYLRRAPDRNSLLFLTAVRQHCRRHLVPSSLHDLLAVFYVRADYEFAPWHLRCRTVAVFFPALPLKTNNAHGRLRLSVRIEGHVFSRRPHL